MRFPVSVLVPVVAAWLAVTVPAPARAGGQPAEPELGVVGVSPAPQPPADFQPDIVVDFDRPLVLATVTPTSFAVFGEHTGPMPGALSFENGNARLRFVPEREFKAGEVVRVVIANTVKGVHGAPLRSAGYAFEFPIRVRASSMEFHTAEGILVRDDPDVRVRVYGGTAGDYDGDGSLDLALITEDAGDVRMVFNRGDTTCHLAFDPTSAIPLGMQPSPSSPADFDRDGVVDLVVSNTLGASVSVLMGTGGGDFGAPMTLTVDDVPRGLTVTEANGDGLPDIVTANYLDTGEGVLNVLLNDGIGGFVSSPAFDGGVVGEWAVASADIDLDGILDLVVGARFSATVGTLLGNGDGTYTPHAQQPAGGQIWKIFLGDVDGDGDVDVTTANGTSNSSSVLLNDGQGGLGSATVYPMPAFTVASDLGDLDGDGDLDWVLSNFSGHEWQLWTNDGSGAFAFERSFPAVLNPACCIMMDADDDHDLDLVLLDELADIVQVQENARRTETLFCFGDGSGASCPCADQQGLPGRGCDNSAATGGVNVTADNASYLSVSPGVGVVELQATGFRTTTAPPVLLVRSTVTANGGLGNLVGDGLLCLGGAVLRLRVEYASGGTASFMVRHEAGTGTFHYQLAYRDQAAFCSPGLINFSNALELFWP